MTFIFCNFTVKIDKNFNFSHLNNENFSPVEHVTSHKGECGNKYCPPFFRFPLTLLSKRLTFLLTWKSTLTTSPEFNTGCLSATVTTHILKKALVSQEATLRKYKFPTTYLFEWRSTHWSAPGVLFMSI